MLDRLRKHASSWMIKTTLGIMGAGLIFYFGYTKISRYNSPLGSSGAIAIVNGEDIPAGKFQQAYNNQLKFYEQMTQGKIPTSLLENLKQNVLQKLIQNKLFAQQARVIGLNISNKELVEQITSNPIFYKDGVFNKKVYLENYKPNYEQEIGEDFEDSLREELFAEKFEEFIRNSVAVSDEEVKQEYLLASTELNLQKITLDPSLLTQKTENKTPETLPLSAEIQSEILTLLKETPVLPKGNKKETTFDTLKKKYSPKIEETGFHSMRDKMAFVGDPTATEALECILKLTPENTVCPEAYLIGNQWVFIKMIAKKEANLENFEEKKSEIRQALLNRKKTLILQQIAQALTKQASIKSFLKASS